MKEELVYIVVPFLNNYKDTEECLKNLLNIQYKNYHIIAVDNGSSAEITNKLLTDFHLWIDSFVVHPVVPNLIGSNGKITLLKLERNYGFAKAVNIGIKLAIRNREVKYILLVNNDLILNEYALQKMVEVAQKNNNIGIVGATILHYNNDRIWFSGGKISFVKAGATHFNHEVKKDEVTDFVTGALMLIKRKLIETIGLFKEKYFFSREDVEFCYRARNKGWKLVIAHEARARHKIASTSGGGWQTSGVYYDAKYRFVLAREFPFYIVPLSYCYLISTSIIKSIVYIVNGRFDLMRARIKGIVDAHIPSRIEKAWQKQ